MYIHICQYTRIALWDALDNDIHLLDIHVLDMHVLAMTGCIILTQRPSVFLVVSVCIGLLRHRKLLGHLMTCNDI